MGWVYIVIRTFPFWAMPLGVALIAGFIQSRKDKKKQGRSPLIAVSGALLIISSVLFLYFRGHTQAVPFAHEVYKSATERAPASDEHDDPN